MNVRKHTFGFERPAESNQTAQSRSALKIFSRRILDNQGCNVSSSQRCGDVEMKLQQQSVFDGMFPLRPLT